MLDELRERASRVLEMARSAGAADAFVTASRRRAVQFEQRDDALERVQESTSSGIGLRLWVDGRYSEHSTSDLAPDRLEPFVREAVAITRALDLDPDRRITDPSLYENRSTQPLDLLDTSVRDLDPASRERLCRAMAEAGRRHDQVLSVTATVADTHTQMVKVSTNGFLGDQEQTSASFSTEVTLNEGSDRRADSYDYASATHLEDLPAPEDIGTRALERAVARLGSIQGPTRRTTMVVEPQAATSLVSRLLRPANAEALSQERSYFHGRIGQAIVAERLTVTDTPLLARALASRCFDNEGIAARALPIIEDGALRNIYVDTYYGRKIDMAPTTGYSSNVVVRPGERPLAQLLTDVGQGILVTDWLGGNADPTTGEFSFGIRGHLVENGEVGQSVGEMNVSGNLLELFNHLTAIGNDPWMYSSYRVPTLVFENVQFSGA